MLLIRHLEIRHRHHAGQHFQRINGYFLCFEVSAPIGLDYINIIGAIDGCVEYIQGMLRTVLEFAIIRICYQRTVIGMIGILIEVVDCVTGEAAPVGRFDL